MKNNPIYVTYQESASHSIAHNGKCFYRKQKMWTFRCEECLKNDKKFFFGTRYFNTRKKAKDAYYIHLDRYH